MKNKVKPANLILALVMVFGAVTFFVNGSNAQNKMYRIGDKGPAGGWIFYDKGRSSDGWRYLEAAPEDQGDKAEWGCYTTSIPGAKGTAMGTGKSNTQAIIKRCFELNIAAKLCTEYRGGGRSDWFLPSKDEVKEMYTNLQKAGIGGFDNHIFWSSSEYSDNLAWLQGFSDGDQTHSYKDGSHHVRAVRAF